jgi:hypothetical protein
MNKTVVVNFLTPGFRKSARSWYEGLPADKRTVVDAWLSAHPLPPERAADRYVYAYCEVPAEIDPWITCSASAADLDDQWVADRQPLVEVTSAGDVRLQFRGSELKEVASA